MEQIMPWDDWEIVSRINMSSDCSTYEIKQKSDKTNNTRSILKVLELPWNSRKKTNEFLTRMASINAIGNGNITSIADHYADTNTSSAEKNQRSRIYIREWYCSPLTQKSIDSCDEKTVLQIGIDICNALETLEQLELLHLRVNPEHIFIWKSEDEESVGYCLSCCTPSIRKTDAPYQSNQLRLYSRFYSAPEIFNENRFDRTSDLYSLGMILYVYLNEGCFPFLPQSSNLLYSDYEEAEMTRLKNLAALPSPLHASEEAASVILKALAYNPEDRYQSASDLKKALFEVMYHGEMPYPDPKAGYPSLPWESWEIEREIGVGGFGIVYEARYHGTVPKKSAIKIIQIPQNKTQLESFRIKAGHNLFSINSLVKTNYESVMEEIAALERFGSHPNIVHLEDYKEQTGVFPGTNIRQYTAYMRMELLQPIQSHFLYSRLDEKTVLQMGCDISNALMTIESYKTKDGKRVFHRDVTPENILIAETPDGRIRFKLSDFGIIRKTSEFFTTQITKIGKKFYIAPEIIQSNTASSSIDVYSLGMTLYYFLNDNLWPFVSKEDLADPDAMRKAEAIRVGGKESVPRPKNASEELSAIVLKAIAYKPEDRYQSASEMRDALLEYQRSSPDLLKQMFY